MINNFDVIDSFLIFREGYFYKFEALVRNTDGPNPLFYEGISNTNKNILIKNWYIDNQEYYEKMKPQMKALCDMTGARLYVTLDRKENNKLIECIYDKTNEMVKGLIHGVNYGTKKINKLISSCSSLVQSSDKTSKTLMFDIDTKDDLALQVIKVYLKEKQAKPFILETIKGYHVVFYKKFDTEVWELSARYCYEQYLDKYNLLDNYDKKYILDDATNHIFTNITLNPNQLGLVYHPEKVFNEQ